LFTYSVCLVMQVIIFLPTHKTKWNKKKQKQNDLSQLFSLLQLLILLFMVELLQRGHAAKNQHSEEVQWFILFYFRVSHLKKKQKKEPHGWSRLWNSQHPLCAVATQFGLSVRF
jgi:hypothetical protein